MRIKTHDRNFFSFGKLSDPTVLAKSPLYQRSPGLNDFNDANFQYIVNNIGDMFGYAHNTIRAQVNTNDVRPIWQDRNANAAIDEGELTFVFTMNAAMHTYERKSVYGKHFMHHAAQTYGSPIIFAIAAHEIGHLVSAQAVHVLETRLLNGRPALFITQMLHPYWAELCADYLSGIALGKARPPMDVTPQKQFLGGTTQSATHPDGYLRSMAVEIGYQWGRNNPQSVTDQILSQTDTQKQLLLSFHSGFYNQVYLRIGNLLRGKAITLPQAMMQQTNILLGYL